MTSTYANLFTAAATQIRDNGYNRWADSFHVEDRAAEHSIHTALYAAAWAVYGNAADADDATEEAEARFAGFLLLAGRTQRRTSIVDICDLPSIWEDAGRGAGQIVAALDDAAAALTATGAEQTMPVS